MTTVLPLPPQPTRAAPTARDQHLLLHEVRWEDYIAIGNALRDRPALRLTYDRGSLEFMTTSSEHEIYKKWLARLVEIMAEEYGHSVITAGNMTFQRPDLQRGLEPDDCYWIAHEPQMRGRLNWDRDRDPPPDITLEIEVSRSALDRMDIYATLGVNEVWRFDGEALTVHLLQPNRTYLPAERSAAFPAIPLSELVRFVRTGLTGESLTIIRSFREWLRQLPKP